MAAQAGLKPFETDSISPSDVWIQIEGYNEHLKGEWERMRMICYYIHTHSMIDKKHKKKSPDKMMNFYWEKEVISNPKQILEARRKQNQSNGG